ncbi:11134_t:CDS:2, partial [Funneliformis caledonium]
IESFDSIAEYVDTFDPGRRLKDTNHLIRIAVYVNTRYHLQLLNSLSCDAAFAKSNCTIVFCCLTHSGFDVEDCVFKTRCRR